MLSHIHENQSIIIERQQENATKARKQKQDNLLKNKAHGIACSILNMSTADLEDFMMEEIEIQVAICSLFYVKECPGNVLFRVRSLAWASVLR